MLRIIIFTICVLGIVAVAQQYNQNQDFGINSLYPHVPPAMKRLTNNKLNEEKVTLNINTLHLNQPTNIRNVVPQINAPQNLSEQEIDALISSLYTTNPTITNLNSPNVNTHINRNVNPTIVPIVVPQVNLTKTPMLELPTGVELPPGVPMENRCFGGECIVYYQCTNNSINQAGEGLIDIRFSEDKPRDCHHYLDVCCGQQNQMSQLNLVVQPLQPKQYGCGYRNTKGIGYRITEKDSEAQYGEFPWMVAIIKEERTADKFFAIYQCGGSLIHPKVVLTAAHCVSNRPVDTLKIRAGEWDTQTKNEMLPEQNRNVVAIAVHPQYYSRALFNDVALLFLDSPVELAENVQTVCLPPQNAVFDYKRCTATGWGKDVFGREGKYQVILKKVELPVVPQPTCLNSLRRTLLGRHFILHESFICAGGEHGIDMCKGDGGSPLVCPIENQQDRYYQSGIVAWGIGCGEHQLPGVYVNVALFRNWIDQQFALWSLDSSYYTA